MVIYGGTSSGIAAALQTARMGKTAVLIEPTQYLGGLTTGGLGATDIGNKRAIGGLNLVDVLEGENCSGADFGAPGKGPGGGRDRLERLGRVHQLGVT